MRLLTVCTGYDIKLSSAGLVYKHYGKSILASIMGLPADHQDVQTVYLAVYKNFIQAVDAIDNGADLPCLLRF